MMAGKRTRYGIVSRTDRDFKSPVQADPCSRNRPDGEREPTVDRPCPANRPAPPATAVAPEEETPARGRGSADGLRDSIRSAAFDAISVKCGHLEVPSAWRQAGHCPGYSGRIVELYTIPRSNACPAVINSITGQIHQGGAISPGRRCHPAQLRATVRVVARTLAATSATGGQECSNQPQGCSC
jgi:hypothetical protein